MLPSLQMMQTMRGTNVRHSAETNKQTNHTAHFFDSYYNSVQQYIL